MSSHLLWHLAEHQVQIGEMTYIDKNGEPKPVFTGQALRLLLTLCHHANDAKHEVWISQNTMKVEAGLDGRTVQRLLKRFLDAGLLAAAGLHHNQNAKASRRLVVTLPGLDLSESESEADVVARTGACNGTGVVARTDTRTVARMGACGTGTETGIETPHTQKTLREDKVSTLLTRMGVEYANKELQKARDQGQRIVNPEAWKATVSKKVSHPRGELYGIASDLVAGNPGLPPDQIADMLRKAEQGPLHVAAPEKLSQELDTALSVAMGHAHAYGKAAAVKYCKEQPEALQHELLKHLHDWDNGRGTSAQRDVTHNEALCTSAKL